MPDLVENFCAQSRRKTLTDMFVYLDKTRPHNLRQFRECTEGFRVYRVPHPAYSPDLGSTNFFVFGHLKAKLTGLAVQSGEKLILTIRQIFDEILKEKLISVFHKKNIDTGDQEQMDTFIND
jgi:hypothetical protein